MRALLPGTSQAPGSATSAWHCPCPGSEATTCPQLCMQGQEWQWKAICHQEGVEACERLTWYRGKAMLKESTRYLLKDL